MYIKQATNIKKTLKRDKLYSFTFFLELAVEHLCQSFASEKNNQQCHTLVLLMLSHRAIRGKKAVA